VCEQAGPARPRAIGCDGAGGCVIASQDRHENFSRTCWMTFHCRGITSNVSVTSSPSLCRTPPQHGLADSDKYLHSTRDRDHCAIRSNASANAGSARRRHALGQPPEPSVAQHQFDDRHRVTGRRWCRPVRGLITGNDHRCKCHRLGGAQAALPREPPPCEQLACRQAVASRRRRYLPPTALALGQNPQLLFNTPAAPRARFDHLEPRHLQRYRRSPTRRSNARFRFVALRWKGFNGVSSCVEFSRGFSTGPGGRIEAFSSV
jgi:hypothetical protein